MMWGGEARPGRAEKRRASPPDCGPMYRYDVLVYLPQRQRRSSGGENDAYGPFRPSLPARFCHHALSVASDRESFWGRGVSERYA